jgi:hypothetical protein
MKRVLIAASLVAGGLLAAASGASCAGWMFDIMWTGMPVERSIDDRLAEFGAPARARLAPHFVAADVPFPPAQVSLLAFKDARMVEVYARAADGTWRRVRTYPILAASGSGGPKLREGDKQVPEGIYGVTLLNPNSRFHVSLRLDYPNPFDREMAQADGRTNLGGDIMIHGDARSIGCLAMGDEAAEEFFTLVAAVGLDHVKVVISPTDFRRSSMLTRAGTLPPWTDRLYRVLASELSQYPSGF